MVWKWSWYWWSGNGVGIGGVEVTVKYELCEVVELKKGCDTVMAVVLVLKVS